MKNVLHSLFLLIICVSLVGSASAQSNFNIQLGAAYPLADFGNDDINEEDAAGAGLGFTLGGQYTYRFSEAGLGIFAGIDINYNPLKKDARDVIIDYYESNGLYGADQNFYEYVNIPISIGVHYNYNANEKFGLLFNGGLVLNIFKMTKYEVEYQNFTITTKFDPTTAVGFKVGAGILLNQKFTIKIDYLGLGKNDIEGEITAPGEEPEKVDGEAKVSLLNLSFGYRF